MNDRLMIAARLIAKPDGPNISDALEYADELIAAELETQRPYLTDARPASDCDFITESHERQVRVSAAWSEVTRLKSKCERLESERDARLTDGEVRMAMCRWNASAARVADTVDGVSASIAAVIADVRAER